MRFDWPGAAMSTAALVTFLMLMTNGYRLGWGSPAIIGAGILFVTLLAGFIWWELRAPAPMLDLSLFKHRVFSLGGAGQLHFVPERCFDAVHHAVLPTGSAWVQAQPGGTHNASNGDHHDDHGPIAGRLSDRYGYRAFNVAGLILAAAGIFTISRVSETTPLPIIIGALVMQSAGTSLFASPNSASIFGASQGRRHGVVAALLSLVRNSANVTSIAVATAVVAATMVSMGYAPDLSNVSGGDDPGLPGSFVSGMNLLYFAMGCLLIVGVVASFLKGPAPAGTRGRRRPVGVQAGD